MTLRKTQSLFTFAVAHLIIRAYEMGYEVTFGDAHRTRARARALGFANSNHTRRLAIDLNLFREGIWMKETEDHRELGELWESLHPLARWGGRFGDGNHYSFEWEGVM